MRARPFHALAVAVVLAAAPLLIVPAFPAHGAPAAQPAGTENPFLTLFPEARTMPAPDWLRPGLRATYHAASATTGAGDEGSAGAGFLHYDVVALDRRNAVLALRFFLDSGDGAPTPSSNTAAVTVRGAGDFWLHPDLLADAERVANPNLAVVHMPYEFDGQDVPAVRFQSEVNGLTSVWVFEEASGLLLYASYATGEEGELGRNLGQMTLLGTRRLPIPWAGKAAPRWVGAGDTLHYEGHYAADVGGGGIPIAISLEAEFARAQPTWTTITVQDSFSALPTTQATGVAQLFGGWWLPAEAVGARVRRPLLDWDPFTNVETRYEKQGGGVLLTEGNEAYTASLLYDRSGRLVAYHQEMSVGVALVTTDLALVE